MKDSPLTEGNMRHGVKPLTADSMTPIAPPPAGERAPAGHYMTDAKASQLSEQGFKQEGYIMRNELGEVALVHCGKVIWLTPDEMNAIFISTPDYEVRYSDEEN